LQLEDRQSACHRKLSALHFLSRAPRQEIPSDRVLGINPEA
jgi:hypothetical protein